jgi:hypothetical protein
MNAKAIVAFVLGVVAAAGVAVFLTRGRSGEAPQVVVQRASEPALSPLPESTAQAEPKAPEPAPPAEQEPPKPAPVMKRVSTPAVKRAPAAAAPSEREAPAARPVEKAETAEAPPPPPQAEAKEAAPAPAEAAQGAPPKILRPDLAVEKREPHTVTIPAGTMITVRLREALSSEKQSDGDPFQATLDQPLVIDGFVIAERGALVRGRVVNAVRAGRVKGRATLGVELMQLNSSDGQKVDIKTDTFVREAESGTKKDAAKVGVAAGIGAAIGAIVGGGKGAAIGGAVGGAGGAGTVLATRGEEAKIPSETRLTFSLKEPVTLTEKLKD